MKRHISASNVLRHLITTIFGVALMAGSGLYLWYNIKILTLEHIGIGSALAAVGFVFLFVKDSVITGWLPKR